jgi:hypothetical protein
MKIIVPTTTSFLVIAPVSFVYVKDGPHVEERMTIGDIAAFKARELFALTGLPSVAERTSV